MSNVFRRRLRRCRKFSFAVHSAQSSEVFLLPDPPIISEVSALVARLLFSYALVLRVSLGSACQTSFPVFSGLQNYWREYSAPASNDTPRLRAMFWEVFSLPSCFVVQQRRRSLGISSLLYNGLTLVDVFPLHSV